MLHRMLVVVGLVGALTCAAENATAEDAAPHASYVGANDVSFTDPSARFEADRFRLAISPAAEPRFTSLASAPAARDDERRFEIALVARALAGIDVAFAQRGGVGFNAQGDVASHSRASELRLGRGLRDMPRDQPSSTPKWYVFAGSEDEALIWRPGARNSFGDAAPAFALQDRVEIGDRQAGITYEHNGLQASLAYVEREISVRTGSRTVSRDEAFAGFTLTMRR